MDSWSTGDVAALTGLSIPAVHRAVARFDVAVETTARGHLRFGSEAVTALVEAVGAAPVVDQHSRQDLLVLRALSLAPLGLRSRRAVARTARVSPTTAGEVLDRMVSAGLVCHEYGTFAEGVAAEGELWRLAYDNPGWLELAPVVATVVLPRARRGKRRLALTLPRRLHHLFWNAEPSRIDVQRDAEYIASRLLLSDDAQGLAWAAQHLPAAALEAVTRNRAATNEIKATARNLAAVAR
jgi:hypothetical protein